MNEPLTASDREAYQAKVGVLGPFVDEALARYEVTVVALEAQHAELVRERDNWQNLAADMEERAHTVERQRDLANQRGDAEHLLYADERRERIKELDQLTRSQQDNERLRQALELYRQRDDVGEREPPCRCSCCVVAQAALTTPQPAAAQECEHRWVTKIHSTSDGFVPTRSKNHDLAVMPSWVIDDDMVFCADCGKQPEQREAL